MWRRTKQRACASSSAEWADFTNIIIHKPRWPATYEYSFFYMRVLKPGFHSNARNASACVACVAWKIESILSLRFLLQGPLAWVAWLALAYTFVFCLRNFLAFVAFLAHFIFCLCAFPYAMPCVRCVRLNGNRAWVDAIIVTQTSWPWERSRELEQKPGAVVIWTRL